MTANRKCFSRCARSSQGALHSFAGGWRWLIPFFCSRKTAWRGLLVGLLLVAAAPPRAAKARPQEVAFSQSSQIVEAFDFVEVALNVSSPDAGNPFTEVSVEGQFGKLGEAKRLAVDGFCDSPDGSLFRIRFMPSSPGDYAYSVTYRQGSYTKFQTGSFRAIDGHRRGPVRVDPKYPWHFIWEGTGEHYFYNGTTAFLMMGWQDDRLITGIIDRLHDLKVNRIRLMLAVEKFSVIGVSRFAQAGSSMPI